ncbi:30S ribosomal protein S16 [Candidatus Synchoanobacter obligatus]|uniref:Small ribosomal subunit protein bS16 n=1 Tax=Candidatus Synchoanobacter obligatus TaxID=2919597 RepID=A0ABT1L5S9_9GAMM|nr:30S ribosomal protein S16 [Candidatus Synchoanobacter obligatus]MCP8352526.1 30S ribosomal protein S16 [Candidatus Synchoanobacter obligatus]
MVKIRFSRGGRKKAPFYHIIVADSRSARDGKFIERIGHFDPLQEEQKGLTLSIERLEHWVGEGAQMSPRVKSLYKVLKKNKG